MCTRKLLSALVAGVGVLAAPAAAQATTKPVFMGNPPSKKIDKLGASVNAYFPSTVAIHVGDTVKFLPVGFHTVDLIPKGGQPLPGFTPTGTKVEGANDASGQPFWFNGQDNIFFNTGLFASKFGKKATYTGSKRVESGAPLQNKPKPFSVKFKKTGSFTYYCNIHPGMKGKVVVKPKSSKVPSAKADAKVVSTQLKAAIATAKTLPKKVPPANTVNVGSAGPGGVEYYGMVPSTVNAHVGDTITFRMSQGSFETHTATTGPGNPDKEPDSYLGQIAGSFQGQGPAFDPRAVYPSEAPGPEASLTPLYHGNGFWNTGVLDNSNATPLPNANSVKFSSPGTYQFYCLIHTFMHATVNVQ
jgi:plastocyanin